MRITHSLAMALCTLLAALLMCESATSGAARPAADSEFAGSWVGTFTTSNGGFGPFALQISEAGVLRGSLENQANGVTGYLLGTVNYKRFGSGHLKNPPNINIPYLIELHIDESGNLVGSYVALGGFNFTGQFVLARE